ncbi:MAG: hypothetical protein EHM20_17140 [Alphaproteobacteria bacterium]|nr:MAG: hypothetical protein EHM20_17140 [Alphaproteobacteria bacterium]
MRDAKLIQVIAEYLAKCAEMHAKNEPIPADSLESLMVDIASCLNVCDEATELAPLKRARETIRLARREYEWQCDNIEHPDDWETCLRNAVCGHV